MDGTERSLVPGCPNKNMNSRSASSCAAVRCFLARLYLQTNSSINNWLLANRQRTRQRQRKMFRHLINKLLSMDLFVRLDRQWTAGDNMQTLWLTGHHFCWAHLTSHISHSPHFLTNLLVQEVQRQLEADSLHVRPLEGRGDVHVHVQEPDRQETKHYNYISCCHWPAHGSSMLGLLYLQLGKKLHEPLKTLLVPVDPEEVNLRVRDLITSQQSTSLSLTFLRLNMFDEMSSLHW